MELKKRIQEELVSALKKKKELEVLSLRQLLAAILNKEKEKRYKNKEEKDVQLTDEETMEVVSSEAKKRKESIIEFSSHLKNSGLSAETEPKLKENGEKGKIEKFIEKEKAELKILEKYLPEQLSEEEIKKLAEAAVDEVGAKEIKDMGKVMTELMPRIKGKADGFLVSKAVKELLEKRFGRNNEK